MNTNKGFALISVFDKTGVEVLAKALVEAGYKLVSSGGTYDFLRGHKIEVTPIDQITGNPRDSFDGRMKTISFAIEGGILYDRTNSNHVAQAKKLKVPQIDVVVGNLYPFEQKPSIEMIDVGGPTMIRSAAKNFKNVIVLVNPEDYEMVAANLKKGIDLKTRQALAAKAFYHLSFYDSQVANFFNTEVFPGEYTIPLRKIEALRYGENPHQKGALYSTPRNNSPLKTLKKLWGRELSGTNIGDISAGLETVRLFKEPAAVIIKHNTPCGVALGENIDQALSRAVDADPVSAFGGVIVLNRKLTLTTAKVISGFKSFHQGNIDIVAVPSIEKAAIDFLGGLRKSMGIYVFGVIPVKRSEKLDPKFFDGVVNLQDFDDKVDKNFKEWKAVTKKKPTKKQLAQMEFAWKVVKSVKSNSIVVVDKDIPMTRGIGAGQTSRVGSVKIALSQAGAACSGGILASDSFFPFSDSIKLAAGKGIGAIVQQGGSVRDQDSINEANEAEIPMVLTGRRAFRH